MNLAIRCIFVIRSHSRAEYQWCRAFSNCSYPLENSSSLGDKYYYSVLQNNLQSRVSNKNLEKRRLVGISLNQYQPVTIWQYFVWSDRLIWHGSIHHLRNAQSYGPLAVWRTYDRSPDFYSFTNAYETVLFEIFFETRDCRLFCKHTVYTDGRGFGWIYVNYVCVQYLFRNDVYISLVPVGTCSFNCICRSWLLGCHHALIFLTSATNWNLNARSWYLICTHTEFCCKFTAMDLHKSRTCGRTFSQSGWLCEWLYMSYLESQCPRPTSSAG